MSTIVERRSSKPSHRLAGAVADVLRYEITSGGIGASHFSSRYPGVRAGDIQAIIDGSWCERGLGLRRLTAIGEAIGVEFELRRLA